MFINLNERFANYFRTFEFKVWVGNTVTENYGCQMPIELAYSQFIDLAQRLAQQPQPMKVVCISMVDVELPDNNTIQKPAKFVFYNNAYEKEIGINE